MKLAVAALLLASSASAIAVADSGVEGFVHTRVGRATAPFHSAATPVAKSEFTQAVSFVIGVSLHIDDNLEFGLRIPAAPSLVAEPGGSYIDDKTFGNVELFVATELDDTSARNDATDSAFADVATRVGVGLALPTAGHGPRGSLAKNRVLAVSAALEGWSNQQLYVPGTLALTPRIGTSIERGPIAIDAEFELPLFVRLSSASIASDETTRRIGTAPNLTLAVSRTVGARLRAGLTTHVAALVPAPEKLPGDDVQLSVVPQVAIAITPRVSLQFDTLVALGGPLSGTLGIGIGLNVAPAKSGW